MTLIDIIRQALQSPGKSQRGLARAMGLDPAAVNRMLKGERQIKAHELTAIREYLGLPPAEDLPAPTIPRSPGASPGQTEPPGLPGWRQPPAFAEEFAMVPVYDARASAGPGAINTDAEPVCFSAFRWEWLHRVTQAPPDQLAVIQVAGDSMEPTLHHGDHVLIDRTVTRWTRDGLYVIRYAISDELMVKRLLWIPSSRTFSIRSDNPAYGNTDGVGPDDLSVVGRVLWLGRNIG